MNISKPDWRERFITTKVINKWKAKAEYYVSLHGSVDTINKLTMYGFSKVYLQTARAIPELILAIKFAGYDINKLATLNLRTVALDFILARVVYKDTFEKYLLSKEKITYKGETKTLVEHLNELSKQYENAMGNSVADVDERKLYDVNWTLDLLTANMNNDTPIKDVFKTNDEVTEEIQSTCNSKFKTDAMLRRIISKVQADTDSYRLSLTLNNLEVIGFNHKYLHESPEVVEDILCLQESGYDITKLVNYNLNHIILSHILKWQIMHLDFEKYLFSDTPIRFDNRVYDLIHHLKMITGAEQKQTHICKVYTTTEINEIFSRLETNIQNNVDINKILESNSNPVEESNDTKKLDIYSKIPPSLLRACKTESDKEELARKLKLI